MNIQEIAKEIIESLEERKKGTGHYNFVTGKIDYYEKARGKGTKQYTIRRIKTNEKRYYRRKIRYKEKVSDKK